MQISEVLFDNDNTGAGNYTPIFHYHNKVMPMQNIEDI